jgi:hypothetical protein
MTKSIDWHSLERNSRLARVMYPNLADAESQRDMAQMARNEGKKSPMQARNEQLQSNQRSKWYAKDR